MYRHKSLGLLTGILLVPRVTALALTKRPPPLAELMQWEKVASKAGHWALYGFSAVMAGSGIAMGYLSGTWQLKKILFFFFFFFFFF